MKNNYNIKNDTISHPTDNKYIKRMWRNMLNRETKGLASVSQEFRQYVNFENWVLSRYSEQFLIENNFQLDKDLKVFGNKVYSENNCLLIPQMLNNLVKIGKGFEVRNGRYYAAIVSNSTSKKVYLAAFDNEADARHCYLKAKAHELDSYLVSNFKMLNVETIAALLSLIKMLGEL